MGFDTEFEQQWMKKLISGLNNFCSNEEINSILGDIENSSNKPEGSTLIQWTEDAIRNMEAHLSNDQIKQVFLGCACQYPKENLQDLKETFAKNHSIDEIINLLEMRFEDFIENTLKLKPEWIDHIKKNHWGMAGFRKGNRIIATKIPKSGYIQQYMEESDPQKRKSLYCHCPRVREAAGTSSQIPSSYCYCGGGYYKGIWEEILQEPVDIQILKSIFMGDDICQFAVILPETAVK